MIELKKLHAGYGHLKILKGIDFRVKPGQIVSIIGPNGAGKSALLKAIFNQCDIYSGNIIFRRNDITTLPTYDLILEGISYSPQGRQIFPDMTVYENLEMGLYIFKDKEYKKRKIEEILKKFPLLKEKQSKLAYSLSGGQQQILSIARSLLHEPTLFLLDEPSLGLDPKTQKEIFEIIKRINKEGITVIIVEQNAKQAAEISDIIYVLEDGQIALKGDKSILKDKRIKDVYFGGR
ncbi:MAG: ABC transporter ATP-binding protein [Candidatus ainarchaeum sp.]|nr:ABC transporter ATP-binding protein [Candidatus ainarchaeum sp.]MDD3085085.1 ABC transporter ATP-binding protein [Candidatus ainarchaeum sp.]MDD4221477.1 ABC transporter ATP-binding protein [Candidatus ainarchaeum sp.]MDD4663007.1 ABC transporter ATP-binding protein [Candidatus ainarchaeum sp.]